ncbi:MAG: pectate lyase [Spirochaetales bacterium]|nr:pectate lyase [Spirochaetales bacterium]
MNNMLFIVIILLVAGTLPVFALGAQEEAPEILVSDLTVLDAGNAGGWEIREDIQAGDMQFTDRPYKIKELPEKYQGMDWIITAGDSKFFAGETLATFTVNATATIYVCLDSRIRPVPGWLAGWKDTGDAIFNDEPSPTMSKIYEKKFAKGSTVTLGQNSQSAGAINYMIIVDGPRKKTGGVAINYDWYLTPEAARIGDNYLLYQRSIGGWPKDIDMAKKLTDRDIKLVERGKMFQDATIDNDATTSQIMFLSKLYTATKQGRYKEGVLKGIDFLLEMQYDNGGWPQVYPLIQTKNYQNNITYNDDAMLSVLLLFRDIRDGHEEYAFIDRERKQKIKTAIDKGIECIINTQIKVKGVLTAWCAQHDEVTLKPTMARSYELESISGSESVGLVQFLMEIKRPSPAVINAVQSAIAWFEKVKIMGIKINEINDAQGRDRVVAKDPEAPPLWARFYEIETFRPFFCGRDGKVKYSMAEIERERRVGYAWYTGTPTLLLNELYPQWQKQYAPDKSVLK